MRALAPLPAFLLLAASAASCPFGAPGHVHAPAGALESSAKLPEGKCTGLRLTPPAEQGSSAPYEARDIPAKERPYWDLLGYRFDDAAARLVKDNGAVLTHGEMERLRKPFDASHEKLHPSIWSNFMLNGYRLEENTCRLIGPDAKPLDRLTMMVWAAMQKRQASHGALESLLVKLKGKHPDEPISEDVRREMQALAQAGGTLPPRIKELLARAQTTVGELRAPLAGSYADSTKFFDAQRSFADTVRAALPPGAEPGAAARRKGPVDPDERVLGRMLRTALDAQIAKTPHGRELLSRFRGSKGAGMPDLLVLKLTQNPNEHYAAAFYNPLEDQIAFDHWAVVREIHARLPPDKLAKIKDRLVDAKQLSKLLIEDPTLLPIIADSQDITYFHELVHAAQSRRNRIADEQVRGNLPYSNPLSLEHEAHREHCRYLLSKDPAAIERSDRRESCLVLLKDPSAFEDAVTSHYLSTFSESSTLDDVAHRQDARRQASRVLQTESAGNWVRQKLKQIGLRWGDAELEKYRIEVDEDKKTFLAAVPAMRSEAGGALVEHYLKTGAENRAFSLASSLPPGALEGGEARLDMLAEASLAWLTRSAGPAARNERLIAVGDLSARFEKTRRPWPPAMHGIYERDARSLAEELLAQALKIPIKAPPRRPGPNGDLTAGLEKLKHWMSQTERAELLDKAAAWSKHLKNSDDLRARIKTARGANP